MAKKSASTKTSRAGAKQQDPAATVGGGNGDAHTAKATAKAAAGKAKPANPDSGAGKGKKQQRDEIDDLFGGLKAAKKQKAMAEAAKEAAAAEAEADADVGAKAGGKAVKGGKKGKQKVEGTKDDLFGTEAARGRKRTEEGFAIYSEEELGFGKKGGDTPLCPFDCQCCF
eukprot:scaffold21.g2217.t1